MKGMVEQQQQKVVVERAEEGDKEKKKKRRSHRRSKQTPPVSGCSSVDGICGHAPAWLGNGSSLQSVMLPAESSTSKKNEAEVNASDEQGPGRASNVLFTSLPTMHITGCLASAEPSNMRDWHPSPSDMERDFLAVSSKSCPGPISYEKMSYNPPDKGFLSCHKHEEYLDTLQKKYFVPHWSVEAVNEAIEKGDVFRALFRVNAHNRLEAYCAIDGVPTDILISGVSAQNRAIEGDIVAVMLDPVAYWTRLKGSAGRSPSSVPIDDSNVLPEVMDAVGDDCKENGKMGADCEYPVCSDGLLPLDGGYNHHEKNFFTEAVHSVTETGPKNSSYGPYGSNGHLSFVSNPPNGGYASERGEAVSALGKLCTLVSSFPSKRPTGRVLAVIERSPRRDAVIGFLGVKQWLAYKEGYKKDPRGQWPKNPKNPILFSAREYIQLAPTDPRFPKMMVSVRSLPEFIQERLKKGDATVEMELVAAQIHDWKEESFLPQARVIHIFGKGGEIEPQIAAILFENAIYSANFSPESLACLPNVPWQIPEEELARRKDLRNLCTLSIDPSTATDIDDALSVERVSDDIFRVGVHIADASYFLLPDSALDVEAQFRCTSVYLLRHKIPMLPSLLSENLGSLIPGVDRLAFSIIWDINLAGDIIDHWIGHTVIRSCCRLSYEHAQGIIEGVDVEKLTTAGHGCPELHGQFEWFDVIKSVKLLHQISKMLKENRFKDGALWLDNSKLVFLFDESGMPYESILCERKDSNFLVEEFMLLANTTVAEVISRAFPDSALLRRHPEPNLRKLKDFEAFCSKHGFELDTSSSGQLHLSLQKIREKLKSDPVLFDILISYASRPMQLAAYFCTGDLSDRETEWGHYSLAVPFYTHFTSPLRRYPDIVVHRTLAAVIEAENVYLQQKRTLNGANRGSAILAPGYEIAGRCFTGLRFDKDALESKEGREALSAAAVMHNVPGTAVLAEVAARCNVRKLASKHAEEAGDKLYLWALLKKKEASAMAPGYFNTVKHRCHGEASMLCVSSASA
ncbi:DIS3-like exonuclease 2 isoform X2 [Magnolia sinica]|uniref:DIS3-like exonuclease 2 isoform X2 n=1 Tax=Magnolia sinica TaxID=86752 RepID=UPI002658021E|nr:DIS3-like exonuclease 2 isoform X2 [Magnolia sinica]